MAQTGSIAKMTTTLGDTSSKSKTPGKEDEKAKTMPPPKEEKKDGGIKMLYGNFKHLGIRKSGPGFRMDRMDKHPDANVRKKFKDG